MDLLAATMAPKYASSWQTGEKQIENGVSAVAMFILSNLVSLFAVWLSWTCSTQQGLELLPKVLWAVLAYLFGFIYILYFAFKNRNACAFPMPMPVTY